MVRAAGASSAPNAPWKVHLRPNMSLKEQLIEALFEQRAEEMVALASQAVANPDPWAGLKGFLTASLELQEDRGLKELFLGGADGPARILAMRARILPIATQLVARAQESGQLRPDVTTSDFALTQVMPGTLLDVTRDLEGDVWRRYLALMLQAFEGPVSEPLPVPPPAPDEVDQAMRNWGPMRRTS